MSSDPSALGAPRYRSEVRPHGALVAVGAGVAGVIAARLARPEGGRP